MDWHLHVWTPEKLDTLFAELPATFRRARNCTQHAQLAQAAAVLHQHGGLVASLDVRSWERTGFDNPEKSGCFGFDFRKIWMSVDAEA